MNNFLADETEDHRLLFEAITTNPHVVLGRLDQDLRFVLIDKAFREFLSLDINAAAQGLRINQFLHPKGQKELENTLSSMNKEGGVILHDNLEFVVNGNTKHLKCSIYPVHDQDNQVKGILITGTETTGTHLLKEEMDLKTLAIENSLTAFDVVDANGKFVYANRVYLEMWGYDSLDEILGQSPGSHCMDPGIPSLIIENVKRQGKYKLEFEARRKDGSQFSVLMSTNHYNPGPNELYFSTSIDITNLRQKESLLQQILETSDDIVKKIPSGLFIYQYEETDRLILLDGNPEAERLTGLKLHEIIGKEFNEIYPNAKEQGITSDFLNAYKSGEVFQTEDQYYEDELISGAYRIRTFRLPKDKLAVAFENITEQKKTEAQLEQHRLILENIVNSAPIGIWLMDKHGNSIMVNDYFREATIYPSGETSMLEEELVYCRQSDEKAKNMDVPLVFEETLTLTDGRKHVFNVIKKRLQDNHGRLTGILGIGVDITDRKEHEARLLENDRLKSAFLANMSHEIRSPLNAIIGFSDILAQPGLDIGKVKEYARVIHKRGNDLLDIINDILDISKIEAGQMKVNLVGGNVAHLCKEIFQDFDSRRTLGTIQGIQFTRSIDPMLEEIEVLMDFIKLKQVLVNLLGNAFKFTKDGNVKLSCEISKTGSLLFQVQDTGIGIPPDKQDVVFDSFRQAELETAHKFGGTGLGLAICRGLVELMGGSIWLHSHPGQGSVFSFQVPLIPVSRINETNKHNTFSTMNWSEGKILLVEDDEFNAMFIEEVLLPYQARLLIANNCAEAMHMFAQHLDIRLVLMDIRLPDGSGYDLTREMKALRPNVKIVAQTANAMDYDREKALESGCDNYISKPIIVPKLIEIMQQYL
jgi:PAS domain S-box-containing protein